MAAEDSDLVGASASEQARLVRGRQVSSRELCDAVLARIDRLDGALGAFLHVDPEAVRAAAGAADRALVAGDPVGPLHGVPVGIKDLFDTVDAPTTYGSALTRDHRPDGDAAAVARLRAAGAVVLGKTNTPEHGLAAETFTTFGPRCANPWDLTRTAGGSSGGATAAVAAGLGSIGLASDAGGSIRLPAAWCGVLGLKPTYGRVPVNRPAAASADHPCTTAGPVARDVEDLAVMMDVIAGAHPGEPTSLPVAVPDHRGALAAASARRLRVAFGLDLGMGPCDPAVASGVRGAVESLAAHGAHVEESTLRIGEPHPFFVMFEHVAAWCSARLEGVGERAGELAPYTRPFLDLGAELTAARFLRAVRAAKFLRVAVDEALHGVDVLALPATAVVAWRHGEPPSTVAGRPAASHGGITYGGLPYLALANLTGHPAIVVPCGLDEQGLPVAVQLIARAWDEPTLLVAAQQLLEARPFTARPTLAAG
jgi:Asp-tRNA(Asn)/Glu-tRNA(Gln) amidotransferase A subunit family amidase